MLTWETLRNLPKVDAKDSESGFGALLPGMDQGHNELFATTTTGDAFGMGTKETVADKRFMRGPRAPIAGGPGSGRVEKGLRTSNAIGENVLSEADPQKNTEAQRSWLYSQDVMFENPGGPEAVSWVEMQHAMRCADALMRRCLAALLPHCPSAPLPHCPIAPLLCARKRSGFIGVHCSIRLRCAPHRTHMLLACTAFYLPHQLPNLLLPLRSLSLVSLLLLPFFPPPPPPHADRGNYPRTPTSTPPWSSRITTTEHRHRPHHPRGREYTWTTPSRAKSHRSSARRGSERVVASARRVVGGAW